MAKHIDAFANVILISSRANTYARGGLRARRDGTAEDGSTREPAEASLRICRGAKAARAENTGHRPKPQTVYAASTPEEIPKRLQRGGGNSPPPTHTHILYSDYTTLNKHIDRPRDRMAAANCTCNAPRTGTWARDAEPHKQGKGHNEPGRARIRISGRSALCKCGTRAQPLWPRAPPPARRELSWTLAQWARPAAAAAPAAIARALGLRAPGGPWSTEGVRPRGWGAIV